MPLAQSGVQELFILAAAEKNYVKYHLEAKLAISCDEGVYLKIIAREIIMARLNEFKDIVLMLGTFHMTKIFLGCIGKYLRNSGAETILVENAVFGPNVVQSVLAGGHYVRSVKGIMLLVESLYRLLWVEFFKGPAMKKIRDKLESSFRTPNMALL